VATWQFASSDRVRYHCYDYGSYGVLPEPRLIAAATLLQPGITGPVDRVVEARRLDRSTPGTPSPVVFQRCCRVARF
jgi:hypothetical protein